MAARMSDADVELRIKADEKAIEEEETRHKRQVQRSIVQYITGYWCSAAHYSIVCIVWYSIALHCIV